MDNKKLYSEEDLFDAVKLGRRQVTKYMFGVVVASFIIVKLAGGLK